MVYAPDLNSLLVDGLRQTRMWTEFIVESRPLAPAVLPTGRIVASEGLPSAEDAPFAATIPPGTYPMHAWVTVIRKRGKEFDRRNAALELRVSDVPTVSWEMALTEDESIDRLEGDDYIGFSVDSGCATIADADTCEALRRWDFDRWESVYIPRPLPRKPVPGYVTAVVDPATGANLSVVGSGWGDGSYPTFIGRDADGGITRFVIDFMVLLDVMRPKGFGSRLFGR
ncbi:DUF4241 domain-containing protein [Actinomadura sp. 7K507]|uniref:DUF4241 domain-containing protein n=1 Tax=Actinomadura sp. 7K507 TaxID=2530365 RepID=UPI00104EA730|nr:DUF4241 domain-containing protein [Actinomadura sp. 7K507]TDC93563.1 DUF4241 domain-containing protein [Actinomadura sp. 7K507]